MNATISQLKQIISLVVQPPKHMHVMVEDFAERDLSEMFVESKQHYFCYFGFEAFDKKYDLYVGFDNGHGEKFNQLKKAASEGLQEFIDVIYHGNMIECVEPINEEWPAFIDLLSDTTVYAHYNSQQKGWQLWLNVSDIFVSACSDATPTVIKDLPIIKEMVDRWGWAGQVAYAAHLEQSEPLKHLQIDAYKEARRWVGGLF